jgi:hypothetical protein
LILCDDAFVIRSYHVSQFQSVQGQIVGANCNLEILFVRRTPSFRPLSAENKMDSGGLLSWLRLFVCCSLCALNSFGKERTSRAWHHSSSLSRLIGFQYLLPKAV